MQSPAAAIAWEFRARHRWGMLGVALYIVVLALIKLVAIARGVPPYVDSAEGFAFMVMVPLAATATYFLAVFTFGLDGDLAARQSMYPSRRFTLPVTTTALAAWPMLYGSAAMVVLWLAIAMIAAAVLDEQLASYHLVGGLLTLVGVLLAERWTTPVRR